MVSLPRPHLVGIRRRDFLADYLADNRDLAMKKMAALHGDGFIVTISPGWPAGLSAAPTSPSEDATPQRLPQRASEEGEARSVRG